METKTDERTSVEQSSESIEQATSDKARREKTIDFMDDSVRRAEGGIGGRGAIIA